MMIRRLSRDRMAVLAAIVVPLAVAAILVPFRSSIPNTDAALAMILVVVAVAANGYRLAGILAALSVAVWFDFFLTQPYETFPSPVGPTSRRPFCCWSLVSRSPR
jgi:K+-sensing histidine kinase KdpD